MTGALSRQFQLQYHVPGSVSSDGACPAVSDSPAGVVDVVGAVAREVAGAGADGVDEPVDTLSWDTGPLSPGLPIRTLTLMFATAGAGVGAAEVGVAARCGVPVAAAGAADADAPSAGGVSAAIPSLEAVVSAA